MKHVATIMMVLIAIGFCLFAWTLMSHGTRVMDECEAEGGHLVTIERGKTVCAKLEIIK